MAHADIHSGIHAGMHADTHVFGSTRGYGTVASSRGVRDEEARELESFQFGEASTADRIARLETHAVMTGRALRSGRFAISRMMPAGVDDAGRPTVEVVTLVVEARDYMACVGALPRLAADARLWLDARATAASGARIAAASAEPAPRDPQVLRLFDLWRAAVRHGAIGVVSETESDAVLRLVASLDPVDLLRCRWGIGLLSVSTPADICSVASGVSMHGARDVMRPAQQGAWHCGSESEYAGFRAAALPTLPSVADIELNGHTLVVAGDEGVVRASAVASPRPEARERRVMPFAIGSAVLSTAVLAVAVVMHGRRDETAPIVLGEAKELRSTTDESVTSRDALGVAIEKPSTAEPPATATPTAAPAPAPAPAPSPATQTAPAPSSHPEESTETAKQQPAGPSQSANPNGSPENPVTTSPIPWQSDLALLLADLQRVPIPKQMAKESDLAFENRRMDALDRWIEIAFEANLLDRACKEKASTMKEWRDRDRSSWMTDGTLAVVSMNSGFMATMNPSSAFNDVPLNSGLFADWTLFTVELLKRVESVSPEIIDARMKAGKDELLGPKSGEAFKVRKEAWEETLDNLLAIKPLRVELAKIEALVKAISAEGKGKAAP